MLQCATNPTASYIRLLSAIGCLAVSRFATLIHKYSTVPAGSSHHDTRIRVAPNSSVEGIRQI